MEKGDESGESVGRENVYWKWIALGLAGIFVFTLVFETNIDIRLRSSAERAPQTQTGNSGDLDNLRKLVLPTDGIILPIVWGDLGQKMIESGVIDEDKFGAIYERRGGLSNDVRSLIYESNNKGVKMTQENANEVLNLLWAFGLSNKNKILEEGPMVDARYGGDAGGFASTAGWTLSKGNAMDHYSKYSFVVLTDEQQKLVERVSKNIYRPCCDNPTYFPDCNHGMAMLGLLELLAVQDISEEEMYDIALRVNSYWFPDAYITIAKYFDNRGVSWSEVSSKEILSASYSGASGYGKVWAEVEPIQQQGGGSCGV